MLLALTVVAGCASLGRTGTEGAIVQDVAAAAGGKCLATVNHLTHGRLDEKLAYAYIDVSKERLVVGLSSSKLGHITYAPANERGTVIASCRLLRNRGLDIVSVREGGTFKQLLPVAENVVETFANAPVVLEDMEFRRVGERFELIGRQPRAETIRKLDNEFAREYAEQQIRGLARLQELDGRAVVDHCLDQYRMLSGVIDPTINFATLQMWADGMSEVRFKATLRVRGWIREAQNAGELPEYEMVFVEDDGSETWEPLPFVICRTKGSPPEILLLVDGTRYLVGNTWSRRYPDYLISVDYRKRGDHFLFEKLHATGHPK